MASNDFRKSFYTFPSVWLRMENRVFRKMIYFDHKIKAFDPKNECRFCFTFKSFLGSQTRKERERERESELDRTPPQTRQRDRTVEFAPLRSHHHRDRTLALAPPSRSSPPKTDPPKTDLIGIVVTDLILVLNPKLIGVADLVISISSHQ